MNINRNLTRKLRNLGHYIDHTRETYSDPKEDFGIQDVADELELLVTDIQILVAAIRKEEVHEHRTASA